MLSQRAQGDILKLLVLSNQLTTTKDVLNLHLHKAEKKAAKHIWKAGIGTYFLLTICDCKSVKSTQLQFWIIQSVQSIDCCSDLLLLIT